MKDLIRQLIPGESSFVRRFYDTLPLYQILDIQVSESSKELEILPPFIGLAQPLRLKFQLTTPVAPAIDISVIKEMTRKQLSAAEAGVVRSFMQRWHWENSYHLLNKGLFSSKFKRQYAFYTDLDKTRLMSSSDCFIDVGAYTGFVSVKALALGKSVFAIEAQSDVAEITEANLSYNSSVLSQKREYEVFNVLAVGKGQAVRPVHMGNQALYASALDAKVDPGPEILHEGLGKPSCLDDLLAERLVDKRFFLNLEINGNELAALSGATEILRTATKGSACRFPIIYPQADTEINSRLGQAADLFRQMDWRLTIRRAGGRGFLVVAAKV